MRKDHHQLPKKIQEEGFDFHWDNEKVWILDIPTEEVNVSEIDWVFDLPFWSFGGHKYNLNPREVLADIDSYPEHKERILNANTSFPIDLMQNQSGRWLIIDGLHRFARLFLEGNKKVQARKIPRTFIPLIEKSS